LDETYIKVRSQWLYLYRAVDSEDNTLDFLLNETRSTRAAKRFFRKMLGNPYVTSPRVDNVDQNSAYYLTAWRTIRRIEANHIIQNGQIESAGNSDIVGQKQFIHGLFSLT
jgi:transposase-like protein